MGRHSLVKATAVISAATIASSLLGFARETVIAKYFGATAQTDAYLVAFIIPGAILSLLGGALPGTMIPVFTQLASTKREDEAWRMCNTLTNLIIILLTAGAIVGWLLAPDLVPLLAPGFSKGALDLAVYLTRIMMPMVVFITLAGLATAILQSYQKFTVSSLVGVPFNLIIIAFTVFFSRKLGIAGLALGTVLAGISQWLFQLPAVWSLASRRRRGLPVGDNVGSGREKVSQAHFRFSLEFSPAVRQVGKLLVPILLGGAVGQIASIIDRIMASGLPAGSIAALNYGNKVKGLPLGIFVGAIGTAIYPALSLSFAQGRDERFKAELSDGLRLVSLIMVPATIGLMVLGEPIVRLLFERGAFDRQATILTNQALLFYAVGLLPMAFHSIIAKAFWAFQDTWTPLKVGALSMVADIVFNFLLIKPLAHGGLALASSLGEVLWVCIMFALLRRKVGPIGGRKLLSSFVRICLASLLLALSVPLIYRFLIPQGLLLAVAGSILCGIIIYGLGLMLFGAEEAKAFASLLKGRLAKK